MQILVNSNHSVVGTEDLKRKVEAVVRATLGRFGDRITRVEVHLNDVNSHKPGDDDKRCLMEARLGGLKPIAVTQLAPTFDEAIDAAADKLERALDSELGRLEDTPGRTPAPEEIATTTRLDELERAENAKRRDRRGA